MKKKKNKPLIIFAAVFLSLVLVFGGVLIGVTAARNARSVATLGDIRLEAGEAAYFATYYKTRYVASLRADPDIVFSDTEAFWQSTAANGKTYAENLAEGTEGYIRNVLVCSYLYDSQASLSSDEKKKIEAAAEEILDFRAGGNVSELEGMTAEYGFGYSDIKNAAVKLYKMQRVQALIYGADGKNTANLTEECEEHLSGYTHVYLLFIRTSTKFVTGEDGEVYEKALTADEISSRAAVIGELREAIANKAAGADMQITSAMFMNALNEHGEDSASLQKTGYYFKDGTAFTASAAEEYPEIVEAALTLGEEEFFEVITDFGTCFIYKTAPSPGIYLTEGADSFFSDFYTTLSDKLFSLTLATLSEDVTVKDKFYELDVAELGYTSESYVRFD